jgi:hypothetical protein
MPFEVGDNVYINVPDNWDDYPIWTDEMDEHIDLDIEYNITYIGNRIVRLGNLGWSFNPDWLELSESNLPKVTGPYAHVIKKIKQLDRRFEDRKKGIEYAF